MTDQKSGLAQEWNERLNQEGLSMRRGKLKSGTLRQIVEHCAAVDPEQPERLAVHHRANRIRSVSDLARILLPDAPNVRTANKKLLRWLRAANRACGGKLLTKFGSGRNAKWFSSLALIRRHVPQLMCNEADLASEIEQLRGRVRALERAQRALAGRVRAERAGAPDDALGVTRDDPR